MPLIQMKEIFTPLKLVGIKFFKSYDGNLFLKVGKKPRKRLFS